jgi:hypothetical protein
MYLYGSLALGDFDPQSSDIDAAIVTKDHLPTSHIEKLEQLHADLKGSGSRWLTRIEVAYMPFDALRINVPLLTRFPQVEKDRDFGLYPAESGWAIQLYTLREHGVVVDGPHPHVLIVPIEPDDVRRASALHALVWAHQAQYDLEWLEWVQAREHQSFVVVTLCRMLYSLHTGTVASKPSAVRWVRQMTESRWADLVTATSNARPDRAASNVEVAETIAFIEYVTRTYRDWTVHDGGLQDGEPEKEVGF